MTRKELIAKLTEYAEWCDANEWEIPIDMSDLLREAAQELKDMDERSPNPIKLIPYIIE